ncbi:Putative peptidase S8/S53 domain, peptidase S8, subtilisin, Ser-active [Colletotrichum destructivum]|uniref:Peptidase S8/S53 domain, peptidase S8, subtilisin, Ser-active n=1 Tax=Colletotrichum destructivum TaxID=34406 RepID=A0AAX4HYX8_9PEZI|nr:Putative peptidase S8/S53 domain, peptidase S8, subtilisin, Ser-active [Colletotrichum destructivum]
MLSRSLLWGLVLLFLSNRVLTLTYQDGSQNLVHNIPTLPSSASTARSTPYVILMTWSATREQIQDLNNTLSTHATPGSLEGKTSIHTGLIVFFKAAISSIQANAIKKLPGVAVVTPDLMLEEKLPPPWSSPPSLTPRQESPKDQSGSPLTNVRNPVNVRLQSVAPTELKVISQPPGSVRAADLPGFAYASEAGRGVTIYVIDTGANAQNPEWKGMTGSKRFMYLPEAEETMTDGHKSGHGSCVSSKATGSLFGTAKNADIVMLKVPKELPWTSATLAALVDISDDVERKGIKGKAVVNISLGQRFPMKEESTVEAYKHLLIILMRKDIVVVTASGNSREWFNKLSDHPALFSYDTDLIVVGAVDNDGSRADYSQGTIEELTKSAPGDVVCASSTSLGWLKKSGTSFAVPAVVGVIAVWLSQDEHAAELQVPGEVAAKVKAKVKKFSYPRVKGGPPVIWNGIDPRELVCKSPKRPGGAGSGCRMTLDPPASARPPQPPKPQWSKKPQGFRRVFEQDGVIGRGYVERWNSSDFDIKDNVEQWCLDRCRGKCASVFLYRVVQFSSWEYNESYICNMYVVRNTVRKQGKETLTDLTSRYHSKWSKRFVGSASKSADAGIAFK